MVAFDNALWHDRVADPAQRDEETVAIRELGRRSPSTSSWSPLLLPVGDGLLRRQEGVGARRETDSAVSTYRGEEAFAPLGDRDDLAGLDEDRRRADDLRARRPAAASSKEVWNTARASSLAKT